MSKEYMYLCEVCEKYVTYEEISKDSARKKGYIDRCKVCTNKYKKGRKSPLIDRRDRKTRQRDFVEKFNKRVWE